MAATLGHITHTHDKNTSKMKEGCSVSFTAYPPNPKVSFSLPSLPQLFAVSFSIYLFLSLSLSLYIFGAVFSSVTFRLSGRRKKERICRHGFAHWYTQVVEYIISLVVGWGGPCPYVTPATKSTIKHCDRLTIPGYKRFFYYAHILRIQFINNLSLLRLFRDDFYDYCDDDCVILDHLWTLRDRRNPHDLEFIQQVDFVQVQVVTCIA